MKFSAQLTPAHQGWHAYTPAMNRFPTVLIGLLVGLVFFACTGLISYSRDASLDAGAVATQAEVVNVVRGAMAGKVTVRFTDQDGEPVSAECRSCSSKQLSRGDQVRVRYVLDAGGYDVEAVGNQGSQRYATFSLIMAAILVAAAAFLIYRMIRNRRKPAL